MATKPTKQPPLATRKTKADTQLEVTWLTNGEYQFWQLARLELYAKLQVMRREQLAGQLFSRSEIESRRNKLLKQHNAPRPMQKRNLASLIRRLFARDNKGTWASRPKDSKIADPVKIAVAHPLSFFGPEEISDRLRPEKLKRHRIFRRHMAKVSKSFEDYRQWIDLLPEEDIDAEIASLKKSYMQIGRQREWYFSFMLMAERVVKESSRSALDDGLNEPGTRILQHDFLETMKSRFASYWRLHELRTFCYKHQMFAEIAKIERLSNNLEGDTLIRAPIEFSEVLHLIDDLEEAVLRIQESNSTKAKEKPPTPVINQASRLDEWKNFKHTLEQKFTPTNQLLSELKSIVKHNNGWQLEYQVFRTLARSKRIEQTRSGKTVANGRSEVLKFAQEISRRIDREIHVDVEFQLLQQSLKGSDDPQLEEAIINMRMELGQRGIAALSDIHKIKEKFVMDRTDVGKSKNILPLFSKK